MIPYNSASGLRAFLDSEGLGMRKKYGQNFLINPKTRQSLVDALDAQSGDEVWEIGPGLGAMTSMLLDKGLYVRAFEIDGGFIRILKKQFMQNTFTLIEGDIMRTWRGQSDAPFLLGNLPYNIAAALLADFIENGRSFKRIVVTVQKETALRMNAKPGSSDYSSFSVVCSSVYRVTPLIVIKPQSFYPQPNVDSMGVLLEKKEEIKYPAVFYPMVRALFASRRKTVKNNLISFIALRYGNKINVENTVNDILGENRVDSMIRAEKIDIDTFVSLAKSIENMRL
jgi:16S rRNA (adenine1518-N6/adenine1519-N6)-dimethyltransferase